MTPHRIPTAAFILGVVLAACGSGDVTLEEYANAMNAIEMRASARAADILASAPRGDDLTPQDVEAGLERARSIRVEVEAAAADIDPPDAVAALHEHIFDWHSRFMDVEADLAQRAGEAEDTEEGWTALSDSPEMAAYRSAIAEGKTICGGFQDELDAVGSRGAFAGMPWIPADLTESVEVVLGCAWFPDDPGAVYRYPP